MGIEKVAENLSNDFRKKDRLRARRYYLEIYNYIKDYEERVLLERLWDYHMFVLDLERFVAADRIKALGLTAEYYKAGMRNPEAIKLEVRDTIKLENNSEDERIKRIGKALERANYGYPKR
jgi:hypothetical protein